MPETKQPLKGWMLSFEKMDLVDFAGPLECCHLFESGLQQAIGIKLK